MVLTREHFKAIIYYNFQRGLSIQECIDELNSLYADEAPSSIVINNWYTEFNHIVQADEPSEPTIAQAQPSGIALAGPGGVASTAPRGTALAGEKGLAVSSPRATAVAGPNTDKEDKPSKKH